MTLTLILLICTTFLFTQIRSLPKIVGGEEVKDRSLFAYQALILYKFVPCCGGAIISMYHVLTAAHCVKLKGHKLSSKDLTIVAGNLHLYDRNYIKKVTLVFVHKGFNEDQHQNDIALLKILGTFINEGPVRSISLRTKPVSEGLKCKVSGWGTIQYGSWIWEKHLRYVEVPIVDWDNCSLNYKDLSKNVICAGAFSKDACQGDSGGPLVCEGQLAGLVSYGVSGCGDEVSPGIYTEVAKYVKWVEEASLKISSTATSAYAFIILFIYLLWFLLMLF